jgi:hypothetical protein
VLATSSFFHTRWIDSVDGAVGVLPPRPSVMCVSASLHSMVLDNIVVCSRASGAFPLPVAKKVSLLLPPLRCLCPSLSPPPVPFFSASRCYVDLAVLVHRFFFAASSLLCLVSLAVVIRSRVFFTGASHAGFPRSVPCILLVAFFVVLDSFPFCFPSFGKLLLEESW